MRQCTCPVAVLEESFWGFLFAAHLLPTMFENVFSKHRPNGLIFCLFLAKKTFLGQNKSFWGPLELVEKLVPEAAEITASVKDLPGLK